MDVVAPILVRCLHGNSQNPNMAVYAARIVAWLADISPQTSCSKLVNHNVICALCARLLDIEFIDVAESCLSALSKLSAHVPEACLRQVRPTNIPTAYVQFIHVSICIVMCKTPQPSALTGPSLTAMYRAE